MKAQFLQRNFIFSDTTSPNIIWVRRFQITKPSTKYHFIDPGSEEGRQRATCMRREVCFQELQASMETQTRAGRRDLNPYRSHIVFLCPYRFKHSLLTRGISGTPRFSVGKIEINLHRHQRLILFETEVLALHIR